jgi:hypothetical protein
MNRYDKDRFSRRAVLKTLGVSAGMLPLINAEKALGQTTASGAPKRLVLVTWCNGVIKSSFYPAAGDLSLGPTSPLKTLEPLAPFQKKVLLPMGLGLNVGQYAGHFAWGVLWTGKASGRTGQGPSIDQYVSDQIAKSGVSLPIPLMNTGVRCIGDGKPASWRSAGQANQWEIDPNRLFDRIFASAGMPAPQIDTLRIRRKSVLDFVKRELNNFGTRLGTEDKAKIEAHHESLRDIERRLSAAASGGGAACTKPMIGTGGSKMDTPTLMDTMYDLIAAALKCDVTRVANIDLYDDGGGDGNSFAWLGINRDYHAVAHAGGGAAADKIKIDNWLYSKVARLAKALDDTPEGGSTALDNSLIAVGNGQEDGASHQVWPIPFCLIGTAGGYFKGGRAVSYPTKTPHNKLLATIVSSMGFPTENYGGVAGREGTLPELKA